MKIGSEELINDLKLRTEKVLIQAEKFLSLTNDELNFRTSPESWSILECMEHLNLYGRFYLKEIQNRITENPKKSDQIFKSGFLGNYFANSMLPPASTSRLALNNRSSASTSKSKKMKKMKTFANMNPINSSLDKRVLEEFIQQQYDMLRLLDGAKNSNLNKIKCGITITKLLKLKLGDTFRFVIYHNERHLLQAEKVCQSIVYQ